MTMTMAAKLLLGIAFANLAFLFVKLLFNVVGVGVS
jgi:hypothetical protein